MGILLLLLMLAQFRFPHILHLLMFYVFHHFPLISFQLANLLKPLIFVLCSLLTIALHRSLQHGRRLKWVRKQMGCFTCWRNLSHINRIYLHLVISFHFLFLFLHMFNRFLQIFGTIDLAICLLLGLGFYILTILTYLVNCLP
jgi:hypothetical protein